jgi:WhiB family redox-sensing transcriptional regulator
MTDTLTDDLLDPAAWQPMPWRDAAACRGLDPAMFVTERGADAETAKAVCVTCPVKAECLAYALTSPTILGVWGGTSGRERRTMRRATARKPITHGTPGGYDTHRKRGETPCPACTQAKSAQVMRNRADARARAGAA